MEENKYRKLTPEEIQNLSFDLRICFGIRPWNFSAEIKTVDDWIDIFWVNYDYESDDYDIAKKRARDRARKEFENRKNWLIDIINKILRIE